MVPFLRLDSSPMCLSCLINKPQTTLTQNSLAPAVDAHLNWPQTASYLSTLIFGAMSVQTYSPHPHPVQLQCQKEMKPQSEQKEL